MDDLHAPSLRLRLVQEGHMTSDRRISPEPIPVGPKLHEVDDLLIYLLGKWCDRCERITQPYVSEDNEWPCCDGCWRRYP